MQWLLGKYVFGRGAVGLLIIRLVFGAGIMLHGWQKLHMDGAPFQWMGPNGPPAFLQGLSVLAEFGGGIAIMLGLLTPLASFGLTCNMLVAIFMVHVAHGDPFVGSRQHPGSFEPAADYLAVAICLLIAGPGCLSLDALIFRPLFGKRAA
jgi:putative oxidoreductase